MNRVPVAAVLVCAAWCAQAHGVSQGDLFIDHPAP